MKYTLIKIGTALMLSLFLSWVYLSNPHILLVLNNKLNDVMFTLRGELPSSNRVVIIDIDNKSLSQIGQWPWSRDVVSKLIENLTKAKAGVIGLDMVFPEEDKSSPHLLKEKFPSISQNLPNYDEILAKTFSHSPVVGGFVFTEEKTSNQDTPLIPAIFIEKGLQDNVLKNSNGILLNLPILQNALYSSGFFITKSNEGGVIRSVPLVGKYNHMIYPSLAFEMLRIYAHVKKVYIIGDKYGIDFIQLGDYTIPTTNTGEFIVNFRGPKKHFKYISASDILTHHFNPKDIENKFILIGTSASGLKDLRYIAYDSTFPGVEIHANIIDNILEGDFIKKPFTTKLYDLGIIWGLVTILMFIFSFITSWLIIPIAVTLFMLLAYGLYFVLFDYGLMLNLLIPFFTFFATLILTMGLDYYFTSKQKEKTQRILGKKVSHSVMQHLLQHADEELIQSKEVEATVFFSDIRDFTTISEQIRSPKELIELLNTYMTPMADSIMQHQGTIDKFIGDAIMAYWNTPIQNIKHADLAVTTAIKQIEQLQEINQIIYKNYHVKLSIGIGLHTGIVTAGDMGSTGRSDYTIIGDNVNLASRIEGLTRVYDVEILISEKTFKQLKQSYTIRAIDIVEVKGKNNAIKVYQVLTKHDTPSNQELLMHSKALKLFQEHQLDDAYDLFKTLNDMYPSTLYTHFIARCETYLHHPSKTFTPILKMSQK